MTEVYGGASFGGQDLNCGPVPPGGPNLQQMDAGVVFGGGWYAAIPTSPFAIGGDLMFNNQDDATRAPGSNLATASVMLNARFQTQITPTVTTYVGAGLGAIQVTYDDPAPFLDGSDTIAGYLIETGVSYNLGNISSFTALRYQAGFEEALIQTESVEYNSFSLIVGIRF